jgi:hypothetical protein
MLVPEHLPVEVDREEKEVWIRDYQRIYKFIDSGAALTLFPVWECLCAGAGPLDPFHLARLVEVVALYLSRDYTLRCYVTVSGHATVSVDGSANPTLVSE